MKKNKLIIYVMLLLFASLVYFSVFTIDEKSFAVITQFGKPVRVIAEAGLYFKLPGFMERVNRLDRRIDIFKTQPIQLLLGDKNPLILNSYVCWRIYKPLLFFQSLITPDIAKQKLSDMINSLFGSTLGDYTIGNIINTDATQVKLQEIESKIMKGADEKSREKYGIEIISVGICRINYPSIVANSVYERMKAEREKEAKKYRAEGREEASKIIAKTDKEVVGIRAYAYKKAEIIKGKGDKESIKIYAEAYGEDPELFDFLKSLQALKEILKNKSVLVLSTESEVLKYLGNEVGEFGEEEDK